MKTQIILVVSTAYDKRSSAVSQAGLEHLGLGYLKSYLEAKSISVKTVNFELLNYLRLNKHLNYESELNYLKSLINDNEISLIGFSVTAMTIEKSLKLAKELKGIFSNLKVCFGGPQASVCSQEIIQNEEAVDYVITGDGEKSLYLLIETLKGNHNLADIPNLVYRKSGNVVKNIHLTNSELYSGEYVENILPPSRDDLLLLKKYEKVNEARIVTSRGCDAYCTFCNDPQINPDRKLVGFNPKLVVDEIEDLHKNYGINFFWINDDNFISPSKVGRDRGRKIAQEIIGRNLKIGYRGLFRADTFLENDPLIPLLKRSGLSIAFFGLESGSITKLKRFNKRITPDQYYKVLRNIEENNIGLQIGFIMFDPLTTFEELENDAKFLYDIREMYLFTSFSQSVDLFSKTALSNLVEKSGLLSEETKHNELTKYFFKNKNVGKMASYLTENYKNNITTLDKELLQLKLLSVSLRDGLNELDNQNIKLLFEEINLNNYLFFSCILNKFKQDSNALMQQINLKLTDTVYANKIIAKEIKRTLNFSNRLDGSNEKYKDYAM